MRAAPLLAVSLLGVSLSGCASTLDPRSGEDLIRRVVAGTPALGTLRSVRCPSGLTPRAGSNFACQVKVTMGGRPVSGSIIVHVISRQKVAITGPRDLSPSLQKLLGSGGG